MIQRLTLTPAKPRISGGYAPGDIIFAEIDATAAPFSITLPDCTTLDNVTIYLKKIDSANKAVTVSAPNGKTIDGDATITLTYQDDADILITDRTNYKRFGTIDYLGLNHRHTEIWHTNRVAKGVYTTGGEYAPLSGSVILEPGSQSGTVQVKYLHDFGSSAYSGVMVQFEGHLFTRTLSQLLADLGGSPTAHRHSSLYDSPLTSVSLSFDAAKVGSFADNAYFPAEKGVLFANSIAEPYASIKYTAATASLSIAAAENKDIKITANASGQIHLEPGPGGGLKITNVPDIGGDTYDGILTIKSGYVSYRSKSGVLSDIGAAPASAISGTQYRVPRFATAATIGDSPIYTDVANTMIGVGATPTAAKIHVIDPSISILADNIGTTYYSAVGAGYNGTGAYLIMQKSGATRLGSTYGQNLSGSCWLQSYGSTRMFVGPYDNVALILGTNQQPALTISPTTYAVNTHQDLNLGISSASPALVLSGTGSNAGTIRAAAHTKYWYFFSGNDGNSPYAAFIGKDYSGDLDPGIFYALSSAGSTFRVYGDNATTVYFQVTAGGNLAIPVDSKKLIFGAGSDSSIMDNGTNMVFTRETAGNFVFAGGHLGVGAVPDDSQGFSRCIDVRGTSGAAVYLRDTDDATRYGYIGYAVDDQLMRVSAYGDYGQIIFNTGTGAGQEKARFTTAGWLGINFIAPSSLIDMSTLAASGGITCRSYSDTNKHSGFLNFYKSHNDTEGNVATTNGERIGAVAWLGNSGSGFTAAARIIVLQNGAASTNTPAVMAFETCDGTGLYEWMRINSTGNVSIGNTNNTYRLDVTGSGRYHLEDDATNTVLYMLRLEHRTTGTAVDGSFGTGIKLSYEESSGHGLGKDINIDGLSTGLRITNYGDACSIFAGDYYHGASKVVGARIIDARIDDAINSGDATTDGVIDALRDAMISHGLIAAA
ncbi:hypothetical protein CCP3SC15_300021 [Gammaproteobacteria bacterium]